MKKLFTIISFSITLFASGLMAQSNLTWTLNDKLEKGEIKKATIFNSTFSGFTSAAEVTSFCNNLKGNANFSSFQVITSNATTCVVKFVMKQPQAKSFYVGLARKLNVTNIIVNDVKKPTEEWIKKK